jgi:hypothetical protein
MQHSRRCSIGASSSGRSIVRDGASASTLRLTPRRSARTGCGGGASRMSAAPPRGPETRVAPERGSASCRDEGPPHPNPLPQGERGRIPVRPERRSARCRVEWQAETVVRPESRSPSRRVEWQVDTAVRPERRSARCRVEWQAETVVRPESRSPSHRVEWQVDTAVRPERRSASCRVEGPDPVPTRLLILP